jgi:ubiquitin C-terminal hydrolase
MITIVYEKVIRALLISLISSCEYTAQVYENNAAVSITFDKVYLFSCASTVITLVSCDRLGYDAVWYCKRLSAFRRSLPPPSL